jgi:hypothetical protein
MTIDGYHLPETTTAYRVIFFLGRIQGPLGRPFMGVRDTVCAI